MGLVGPNGAGKTTLVKILLGDESPTTGEVAFGNNVKPAYFSQHATDDLNTEMTVMECLGEEAIGWTETQCRNHLARFLFTGDDVAKRVGMLSGGEKNKLALSRMLLRPCNLLILDEPTNHLDIESCETLTEMLKEYQGTLLLVSHDRYLLNAVTTKTLGFTGDGNALFVEGNYAAWREETQKPVAQKMASVPKPKNDLASLPPVPPRPSNRGDGKARAKAQDAVAKAERAVQTAENKLAEIEALLASGKSGLDMVAVAADYARAQYTVTVAVAAWETASADWEAIA